MKKIEEEIIKTNFIQKVWVLMKPFHRQLYLILAMSALFETVRMGGPYLFGRILDLLIKSNGLISLQTGISVILGLAGIRIVSLIIDYLTDFFLVRMLWSMEQYISTTSFLKFLELSLDYHEKINTGTKISLVNRGTDRLITLIETYAGDFQPTIIQLVVTAILMILTSWKIGIIFAISLIPFTFLTFKIAQVTQELRSKRHDAYEFSSGEVGDTITNIAVVKGFAQEERENRSFQSIWSGIKSINKQEYQKDMVMSFGRNILIEVFYISLLSLGIYQIHSGLLTVGSLVFLINLIERSYSNIYRLGRIYRRATDSAEDVERISKLMLESPTVVNKVDSIKGIKIIGEIDFKHVSFSYSKRQVLKNVSFNIKPGSFTAFVGKSGSGKSTIAKLLSRYYDPTKGIIFIDKKYNLVDLDLDDYRKHTAVVFQDSPVPNRSIWEVISYSAGKTNFEEVEDRIIEASKLAHAHEFIMELENGYQTMVGERGVKLSGGQRQRLAIARALFAKPKILIMDEPTSHLDTLSEALIQRALEDISRERVMTKIIIAHRLSTVQHADQILVMEKGKLVEHGTHNELLNKNGTYSTIVKQSELKG